MGKYKEAEESLIIALKNFTGLEEKTGIIITNLRLAVARNYQGETDAVHLAERTLVMAKKIDNPNLISLAYKTLSDIYFFTLIFLNAGAEMFSRPFIPLLLISKLFNFTYH